MEGHWSKRYFESQDGVGPVEGPAWENPWSLQEWGLARYRAGGRPGRRLTCIGRSVVAADICGFVCVGGYHLIVVLVRAVDTHLGSSTGLAARELSSPGLVSYPPHPA